MGAATLRTRIRPIKDQDVQVAQESPPPPTFTVPAFRPRKHRGGESSLLKDAYPSGFCRPPQNRPLPGTTTTTATDTRSTRRKLVWLSGPLLQDLLHESKQVGVPSCGVPSSRRILKSTRVVIGAPDVVDTVGSELVQFGPGFSIGPAEHYSPRRCTLTPDRPRPRTPTTPISPSRMTIDGSTLWGRSSLLVEPRAVDRQNQRQGLKIRPPSEDLYTYDMEGHKRVRPTTADGIQASAGPEPWPFPCDKLTGRSSRPGTTAQEQETASWNRGDPGDGVSAVPHASDCGDDGRTLSRDDAATTAEAGADQQTQSTSQLSTPRVHCLDNKSNASEHGAVNTSGARDQTPTEEATLADPRGPLGVQASCSSVGKRRIEDSRSERIDKRQEELELHNEDELMDGERIGEAWAVDGRDDPSVWSGDGSVRMLASVTTIDNSAVCSSQIGDDDVSVEHVSAQRSSSTLDTGIYRGILSKDATDILRSHLESKNKPPGDDEACFSVSCDSLAGGASSLISQLLDNPLAARDREYSTPFRLPSIDRSPEMCYVRTKSDVILAVVRKKDLLECDDDAGLRNLKTAACPVRIQANMTLTEGMREISASGLLRHAPNKESRWGGSDVGRAGAEGDTYGGSGRTQTLEYFNSQAGAWEVVRNETDWKVLLAAPAGPQGAGAVFQSAGANCRRADFLVAVSPTPTLKGPRPRNGKTASVRPGPDLDPASARAAKANRTGWRYSSSVTPGTLRLIRASARSNDPVLSDTHEAGTETESHQESEDDNFRRRIVALAGGGKRVGPGPGAALWLPTSTKSSAAVGRGIGVANPTHCPNKAKVRRLVRHLEAGLKLKGRPGAGGLPVGSQKIDMPYTKELAKWSYDEILGIPRTAGPTKIPL
ncbi:unnamed protein product [Ectocarpus fasciculatus]